MEGNSFDLSHLESHHISTVWDYGLYSKAAIRHFILLKRFVIQEIVSAGHSYFRLDLLKVLVNVELN